MKDVAHRAIVQDHDLAQIRLDLAKVFDIRAIAECAVLAIVASAEIGAFTFQPINDWVCVLLDRGGKDYKVIPLAYLVHMVSLLPSQQKAGPHLC